MLESHCHRESIWRTRLNVGAVADSCYVLFTKDKQKLYKLMSEPGSTNLRRHALSANSISPLRSANSHRMIADERATMALALAPHWACAPIRAAVAVHSAHLARSRTATTRTDVRRLIDSSSHAALSVARENYVNKIIVSRNTFSFKKTRTKPKPKITNLSRCGSSLSACTSDGNKCSSSPSSHVAIRSTAQLRTFACTKFGASSSSASPTFSGAAQHFASTAISSSMSALLFKLVDELSTIDCF